MADKPAETWLPAGDAGRLLGIDARTVRRWANGGKLDARRDESDRRAPILIALESLPEAAQKKYRTEQAGVLAACSTETAQLPPLTEFSEPDDRYNALWAWYERLGAGSKQRAQAALDVMNDFDVARSAGVSIGMASAAVMAKHGISAATLSRYRALVDGLPRGHWLPLLAPRYCGNGKEAEFTEEAWEWILARYLSQTEIETSALVHLARQEGEGKGWKIPCTKTVDRRLKRESAPLVILGRKGPKALEASFPTVEKDWASAPLHAMWESDGCRLNLWARWPDGSIGRPFIVTWRECRSRLALSCKGYLNPCGELVMASFREAIENCGGYKPIRLKLDNGREYANKAFTGGQKTRYRFKVKPGEPVGAVTHMGSTAEWSKPGRGRDKPIESWHRMLHAYVDKRPEFAGAYCGKDALSKPEDFHPKNAVPIEHVNKALGEFLHWFNTHHKHRSHGMNGRTPQAVYEELLPSVSKAEHMADQAHLRLLLMAVKTLTPDKDEATFQFKLDGYGVRRYWSAEFSRLPLAARLKKYHVWYHPENPDLPVAIYDGDKWVCDCVPINRIPAVGAGEAAGTHVRQKNALMQPVKEELKAIKAASLVMLPSFDSNASPLIETRKAAPQRQEVETVLQPTGKPGEFMDTETGEIVCRVERPSFPEPEAPPADKEIESLRRLQLEKNLPTWLRDCT